MPVAAVKACYPKVINSNNRNIWLPGWDSNLQPSSCEALLQAWDDPENYECGTRNLIDNTSFKAYYIALVTYYGTGEQCHDWWCDYRAYRHTLAG